MAANKVLSLQEEEVLAEEVRIYPCLFDKSNKAYKEKDAVFNAWKAVAEKVLNDDDGKKENTFLSASICCCNIILGLEV